MRGKEKDIDKCPAPAPNPASATVSVSVCAPTPAPASSFIVCPVFVMTYRTSFYFFTSKFLIQKVTIHGCIFYPFWYHLTI